MNYNIDETGIELVSWAEETLTTENNISISINFSMFAYNIVGHKAQ